MNPAEKAQQWRESRARAHARVDERYRVYHYKNKCGMVGVLSGLANERLVGDKRRVNCPYCLERLKKAKPLLDRRKK